MYSFLTGANYTLLPWLVLALVSSYMRNAMKGKPLLRRMYLGAVQAQDGQEGLIKHGKAGFGASYHCFVSCSKSCCRVTGNQESHKYYQTPACVSLVIPIPLLEIHFLYQQYWADLLFKVVKLNLFICLFEHFYPIFPHLNGRHQNQLRRKFNKEPQFKPQELHN